MTNVKIISDKIEENVATSAGPGTLGQCNQQSVTTTGNTIRFYVSKADHLDKLQRQRVRMVSNVVFKFKGTG